MNKAHIINKQIINQSLISVYFQFQFRIGNYQWHRLWSWTTKMTKIGYSSKSIPTIVTPDILITIHFVYSILHILSNHY